MSATGDRRTVDPVVVGGCVVALALLALLVASVGADPAAGVTASASPWTDEGWNVVNARNLVLLGHWSTDEWNLYLLNLPYSLLQAAWFAIAGVGIVQARLVDVGTTVLAVLAMGVGLRRPLGWGAPVAALALGASALVLYYGRLAYLEPPVMLLLVLALLALSRPRPGLALGAAAGVALALAIATKASAGFAGAGLLVGVAWAGRADRDVRRALPGALAGLVAVALAWSVLVALPHAAQIPADLRIWASEPLPRSLGELLRRVTSYATRSDGAIPLAAPLLLAGGLAAPVLLALRAELTDEQRRLAAACAGWFVLGMGVLLAVPYRPNRYVVPLLPPLAILAGLAVAAAARHLGLRRGPAAVGAVVLAVALAGPGLVLDARWLGDATSTLPGVQARVAALIPPGSAVQGDLAPVLAMRARAATIVSRPATDINAGDLYASAGVRWVLTTGDAPAWAALHATAWAARTEVMCVAWGPGRTCLYRLP